MNRKELKIIIPRLTLVLSFFGVKRILHLPDNRVHRINTAYIPQDI